MLTVACVLKSGGIYTPKHVERLRDQVHANLKALHRFVCLTDIQHKICENIPLRHNWPGWWSKIELFTPGLFHGRVGYFDLDTLIQDDITPLITCAAPFVICRDWLPIKGHGKSKYNSSIMAWNADVADHIYSNFTPDLMTQYHGDQDYIAEMMPKAAVFPIGTISSWKASGGRIPKNCRVCVFTGHPKPWDLPHAI